MNTVLTPELLVSAYASGYFPMPHPDTGVVQWYRPDPRAVLPLDGFHVSHSLRRTLKRGHLQVTLDKAFRAVMEGCADRKEGTWINEEFLTAYTRLHRLGYAHSVEVWQQTKLVGGVYGVSIGGAFFAESKFHRVADASKVALYYLTEHLRANGFTLLEVQFQTPHLASLGVVEISDEKYQRKLRWAVEKKSVF